MWVYGDFGLVMPAIVDERDSLRRRSDWNEYSEGGKYDFQIRGRLWEHLRYFQDTFMDEGSYHRDIQATPDHDYNYRFYTTQEAFATAVGRAVMAIDYRKFKPSSDRYEWNDEYHDLLTRIWSVTCDLNTPGDVWGPWSPENPKGYRSAAYYTNSWSKPGRRIGDSFGNIQLDDEYEDDDNKDAIFEGWYEADETEWANYHVAGIIDELDRNDIPMSEWWENLTPSEFEAVRPALRKHFSKNAVRKMAKSNRGLFVIG